MFTQQKTGESKSEASLKKPPLASLRTKPAPIIVYYYNMLNKTQSILTLDCLSSQVCHRQTHKRIFLAGLYLLKFCGCLLAFRPLLE